MRITITRPWIVVVLTVSIIAISVGQGALAEPATPGTTTIRLAGQNAGGGGGGGATGGAGGKSGPATGGNVPSGSKITPSNQNQGSAPAPGVSSGKQAGSLGTPFKCVSGVNSKGTKGASDLEQKGWTLVNNVWYPPNWFRKRR